MKNNRFDKQKFINHILFTNAQALAKDCIRWEKNDLADKLLLVKLETAENDLPSDIPSYLPSDIPSYLRSYLLSYLRSYLRSDIVREFTEAFIYAGGELNDLKVKKLNTLTLKGIEGGKLSQQNWHTCKTTHCRGGWYVVVSKLGWLEKIVQTEMTASMIALASTGEIPDFHNMDNSEVLNDIKKWAAKE